MTPFPSADIKFLDWNVHNFTLKLCQSPYIYLPEAPVAITAARKSTGKIASRCFISLPFGFLTFLNQVKFATTDNTKIAKKYGFGSDQP